MFRGGFHHVPHLAPKYPLEFKKKNTNRKKYSLTPVLSRAVQGVKLPILSKKCIFRAENVIFLKSSFYTKFISDPKYSFSVGQKPFFVVQSKVSIFHQILPSYYIIKIVHFTTTHKHSLSEAIKFIRAVFQEFKLPAPCPWGPLFKTSP